ncbi:NAD(P)/FAD-dependent oxidoreductase [Chryseobacterium gwangjuense]|uniref:NAD(P)/FAD-dependent oxidoreductase n=1 Tax=Chryseobacterium gwangjuense TaxID=1069980 RepID=UPI001E45FF75|nr:FAD-binding oxidoreductase [Chryseobacterium gwangjuense]MCE3075780.1 FAD-binding oxidoreductase [Chryseobacterium gwangjuense]
MDLKSNEPFWLLKNGLIQSYPSLKSNEECEVLVIGGGITGSLIAHQMIKEGYTTILIDKRELCNGSTSATTSMLQYEIDIPLFKLIEKIGEKGATESYKACSDAIDVIEKLSTEIKSDAGFKRKESLYFASKKKDVKDLKKEFEARKNTGFKVKWMEADDILKRFGFENTYGGILSKQGASMDAFKFTHELFEVNARKGLKIFDKTEVVEVEYRKGFNIATVDSGFQIRTKKIIYCTGYESKNIIKENFVDLKSTYAIVSEVAPEKYKNIANTLVWNTDNPYMYMRTTDDGRLLIGGGDEDFYDAKKRDAFLDKKEKEILRTLKKIKPDYTFFTDFIWAGTFGETKDGLPYIGTHEKFKNSYFVLGFGGNGITFSVTGMEMVSLFLKGKKHRLSKYFRFGR